MADEAQQEGRALLGRNQLIACVGYGAPLLMTYALVWSSKVTGPEWLSHVIVYVPLAMGTILAISGALKAIQALKGQPQ